MVTLSYTKRIKISINPLKSWVMFSIATEYNINNSNNY